MKKKEKSKALDFFKSLKKKIEIKNPDLGVGLHTIKMPKGATATDARKLMAKIGHQLGTAPTEVKSLAGKTATAVVADVTKWRKKKDIESFEERRKELRKALKNDPALRKHYKHLEPLFFIINKYILLYKTGKMPRAHYLKLCDRINQFLKSR